MMSMLVGAAVPLVATLVKGCYAATAQTFEPPCASPLEQCGNYTGWSNGSLPVSHTVTGFAFDRFIQIWFENTDFQSAASTPQFAALAQQGILLNASYGVTHPSEPNYIAAVAGDFFGLNGDSFLAVPSNVSSIVDVLDTRGISWASYQENMPYDGFTGFNYTQGDYLTGEGTYTYYVRKHSPLTIMDNISSNESRALRNRNFNDLAVDVKAGTVPQWVFITPNLVNDAHDTTANFAGEFIEYFLPPLLNSTGFNDNRTLILVTFDENENYDINNQIYSFLLGGAIPEELRGTTDNTYYTHYSSLSSVQANWGLPSLGRGDTNKTLSNVYSFMSSTVNYTNVEVEEASRPFTNITDTIPGPLNVEYWIPFVAPNITAEGASGQPVFYNKSLDTSLTIGNAPAPVNLTAVYNTTKFPANNDPSLNISWAGATLSGVSSVPIPTATSV